MIERNKKSVGWRKKVSFFCSHNQCWLLSTFQPKYLLNFSTILQNSSVPDFWQTQLIPGLVKERGHRTHLHSLLCMLVLFCLVWIENHPSVTCSAMRNDLDFIRNWLSKKKLAKVHRKKCRQVREAFCCKTHHGQPIRRPYLWLVELKISFVWVFVC